MHAMYYVSFINDRSPETQFTRGPYHTIQEAKEAREVNGDLVFDQNGDIVEDKAWLFGDENDDANRYAVRSIDNGLKIKLKPFRTPNCAWSMHDYHFRDALRKMVSV